MPDPLPPRPAPTGLQRLAAQPLPVVGQALLVAVTQDPWPVPLPCPLTPWLVHRLVRPAARDDYLAYAQRQRLRLIARSVSPKPSARPPLPYPIANCWQSSGNTPGSARPAQGSPSANRIPEHRSDRRYQGDRCMSAIPEQPEREQRMIYFAAEVDVL